MHFGEAGLSSDCSDQSVDVARDGRGIWSSCGRGKQCSLEGCQLLEDGSLVIPVIPESDVEPYIGFCVSYQRPIEILNRFVCSVAVCKPFSLCLVVQVPRHWLARRPRVDTAGSEAKELASRVLETFGATIIGGHKQFRDQLVLREYD